MEPVDVILGVSEEIEQLRKEGRTWQEIQSATPALQAIGLATVKQYGRVVLSSRPVFSIGRWVRFT